MRCIRQIRRERDKNSLLSNSCALPAGARLGKRDAVLAVLPVLLPQPPLEDIDDVLDLHRRKRLAPLDAVPLLQAFSAAGGRGVLGDEDGMAVPGRLLAVVEGLGRGKPLAEESPRVMRIHRQRFFAPSTPESGRPRCTLRRKSFSARASNSSSRSRIADAPFRAA